MLRDEKLSLFKSKAPEYTIRLLLSKVTSDNKEPPQLKSFSHFTLGCTSNDETVKVGQAFEKLSDFFKDPVIFNIEGVINLGSETQPLWGVSLNLGKNEEILRTTLSAQFDSIMCPERNGILYLWQQKDRSSKKCPHITIGSKKEDLELANKLLELKCSFFFDRIDYKKVGPNDPHLTMTLNSQIKNKIDLK